MSDIIEKLTEVDKILKQEAESIKKYIEEGLSDAFESKYFKREKVDLKNNEIEKTAHKAGIYVFWWKNSKSLNEDEIDKFNNVKYGSKISINKVNASNHFIYLGKSYDLMSRIKEHLSSDDILPYSLKFGHENRKALLNEYNLSLFFLNDRYIQYKTLILSTVETYLHESCSPLVGSKRV